MPGRLIVISGPSGVGKGTVIGKVLQRRPGLSLSTSWTTRPPRPGEADGRDYHFVDPATFQRAIDDGELLEWEMNYREAWYGTPWSEVRRALEQDRTLLLELDVRGAHSVKSRFPEAVTIFVRPPSFDVLEARLRGRATNTPEQIEARLADARRELADVAAFDHQVLNDDADACAERVVGILEAIGERRGSASEASHPRGDETA